MYVYSCEFLFSFLFLLISFHLFVFLIFFLLPLHRTFFCIDVYLICFRHHERYMIKEKEKFIPLFSSIKVFLSIYLFHFVTFISTNRPFDFSNKPNLFKRSLWMENFTLDKINVNHVNPCKRMKINLKFNDNFIIIKVIKVLSGKMWGEFSWWNTSFSENSEFTSKGKHTLIS